MMTDDYEMLRGSDAARAAKAEAAKQVEAKLVSTLVAACYRAVGRTAPPIRERPRSFSEFHLAYGPVDGFAFCTVVKPLRVDTVAQVVRLADPKSKVMQQFERQRENYPGTGTHPAALLHFAYDPIWRVWHDRPDHGLRETPQGVQIYVYSKHGTYVLEEYDSFLTRRSEQLKEMLM